MSNPGLQAKLHYQLARRLPDVRASSWFCWAFLTVSVARLHELIPFVRDLPLVQIIILFWVLACFAERADDRVYSPFRSPIMKSTFFLFGLIVFLVPISVFPSLSLSFVIDRLPILVIAAILLYRSMLSTSILIGTVKCLVITGTALALIGILSYTGGRFSPALMYDSNDTAFVLVTIVPLAIGLAQYRKGVRKLVYLGATVILVVAALLTQSRGGLVALLSIAAAYFVLSGRSVPGSARRGSRMAVLLICAIVAAVGWSVIPDAAKERFSTLTDVSQDYNLEADNRGGRLSIWSRLFEAGIRRPWGSGANTASWVEGLAGGQFRAPHNSVLTIFVELGLVGLCAYLWRIVLAWRGLATVASGGHLDRQDTPISPIAVGLQVSLISNFVAGFFLSMAYSYLTWSLMAIIAGMVAMSARKPEPAI